MTPAYEIESRFTPKSSAPPGDLAGAFPSTAPPDDVPSKVPTKEYRLALPEEKCIAEKTERLRKKLSLRA